MGGNVIFLKNDTSDEIFDVIMRIYNDPAVYSRMKQAAERGKERFSYDYIARKSIGEIK